MVDNLILEYVIGIWIFYFKSEISLRLVDHFGFILCDSFREIFDNRVVVLILLWNNKFVSESFIIFFVLFDFLFKDGIFLLWEFELLLFSFKLKLERREFFVECFWGLFRLGLFDSESREKFLFFKYKWILFVKFIVEFFDLQSESFFVGFIFFEFHLNDIIVLLGSSEFIFNLFVILLVSRDNFIIVCFLSLRFRFKLLFEIEF